MSHDAASTVITILCSSCKLKNSADTEPTPNSEPNIALDLTAFATVGDADKTFAFLDELELTTINANITMDRRRQ